MRLDLFAPGSMKRLQMRRTCSDQEREEHETVEYESHDSGCSQCG
jgi:hypothetical protein